MITSLLKVKLLLFIDDYLHKLDYIYHNYYCKKCINTIYLKCYFLFL